MKYRQKACRTNQRFMAVSIIMGLLLIAVVYGFLWWASGRKSSVEGENMEKAGTETCFFVKSACNEAKNT